MFLLASLNLLVACGSDNDDDDNSPQEEQAQDDQGTFEAVLNPLNTSVAGITRGTATVRIRSDEMKVDVDVQDSPGRVVHRQYIYSAGVCPTAANNSIWDVDYAEETAKQAKNTILTIAAISVKAQANQIGQNALKLI